MKPEAILVSPTKSTFIDIDIEILSQRYDLKLINLGQNMGKGRYLASMIGMTARILLSFRVRQVFIWFADYHAFFAVWAARVSNKKSIVFIGGYDAVHYPELGMGVHQNKLRGICNKAALRACNLIIANHQALISATNTYYGKGTHQDGILRFIPGLKTSTAVVFNGIRIPSYSLQDRVREPGSIICVGNTPRYQDFINKGFDLLIEVAKRNPDWNFTFVGIHPKWIDRLKAEYGLGELANLKILSQLPQAQLLELFTKHRVYVQASISEGMPNSLIEAMSMCCVPIGSNVSGIPEVIGNHGLILKHRSVAELESLLVKALKMENSKDIRDYIVGKFEVGIRKDRLFDILDQYSME